MRQQFTDASRGKRYSTNRNRPAFDHSRNSGFTRSGPVAPPSSFTSNARQAQALELSPSPNSTSMQKLSISSLPLPPTSNRTASSPPKNSPKSIAQNLTSPPQFFNSKTASESIGAGQVFAPPHAVPNLIAPSMPIAYSTIPSHPQVMDQLDMPTQEFYTAVDPRVMASMINSGGPHHPQPMFHPSHYSMGPAGDATPYYNPQPTMPMNPRKLHTLFFTN